MIYKKKKMKKIIISTLLALALCNDVPLGTVSTTSEDKKILGTEIKGLRNNLKSSKPNQQPKNNDKNGGAKTI